MQPEYQIRANYDAKSIVIYQAYRPQIADAALEHQRFVAPFSLKRMTWIKPSFLWLMYRSRWGQKSSQRRILAVRIARSGWEKALSLGVLTHPEPSVYSNGTKWQTEFETAAVHVQWDTERSLRGAALNHYSIQVGISRNLIHEYVNDWTQEITDMTPLVTKIRRCIRSGNIANARRLLPTERVYPVDQKVGEPILL